MSIARFLIYGLELLTIIILGFQCLLDRCKRLQYKVRVEGRVTRVRADLMTDYTLTRGGSFTRSCQTSRSALITAESDRPVAAVRRSGRLPITTATTIRMPRLADGGNEPGVAKPCATSPAVPPAVAGPSKPRPSSSIREATELGAKPKRPIVFPRTSFLDTDSSTEEGGTVVQTTASVHPVPVTLYVRAASQSWTKVSTGITDGDGRFRSFFADGQPGLAAGVYKLHFDVGPYFRGRSVESLYPFIEIVFTVADPTQHYHIPLLLNPFGYSTYRGS
uniref:hydroxyisourate hydrolase n=1 Tax=Anopheles melas TaxID=34690 RepID=A0A182TJD2_9DIPT